jgi:hypothetical protein
VAAKVAGELEESYVLFAHRKDNADCGHGSGGSGSAGSQADDGASGSAEPALQGRHLLRQSVKVPLEKFL